jgi:hypothetical protein
MTAVDAIDKQNAEGYRPEIEAALIRSLTRSLVGLRSFDRA